MRHARAINGSGDAYPVWEREILRRANRRSGVFTLDELFSAGRSDAAFLRNHGIEPVSVTATHLTKQPDLVAAQIARTLS